MQGLIIVEGLLEKGEQDRDDDDGLEGLAEGDEEDGDGEDVGHCDGPSWGEIVKKN